jgi:hypothetical protein
MTSRAFVWLPEGAAGWTLWPGLAAGFATAFAPPLEESPVCGLCSLNPTLGSDRTVCCAKPALSAPVSRGLGEPEAVRRVAFGVECATPAPEATEGCDLAPLGRATWSRAPAKRKSGPDGTVLPFVSLATIGSSGSKRVALVGLGSAKVADLTVDGRTGDGLPELPGPTDDRVGYGANRRVREFSSGAKTGIGKVGVEWRSAAGLSFPIVELPNDGESVIVRSSGEPLPPEGLSGTVAQTLFWPRKS